MHRLSEWLMLRLIFDIFQISKSPNLDCEWDSNSQPSDLWANIYLDYTQVLNISLLSTSFTLIIPQGCIQGNMVNAFFSEFTAPMESEQSHPKERRMDDNINVTPSQGYPLFSFQHDHQSSWHYATGVWCCLILISVRTFCFMYDHTFFLYLQITRADIRPQVKWAVNLVIADGHFNLPRGFVDKCGFTYG